MVLYSDHLILDSGIQHRRVSQLKANNYNPEYVETRTVSSESSDREYLLGQLRVLSVPFEDADSSKDTVTAWVCSCDDFYYNRSAGVEDGGSPTEMGECKHITSAVKSRRAMADDQQASLRGVGDD